MILTVLTLLIVYTFFTTIRKDFKNKNKNKNNFILHRI